jgi:hypothetical protein
MAMAYHWTCSFCSHDQIVTEQNYEREFSKLYVGKSKYGDTGLRYTAIRCANVACNEITLSATFVKAKTNGGDWIAGETLQDWQLRPGASSKVQPDYIPLPLREDYFEACLIRDNSPKASATLARRCLQGMIRDFCGIAKGRLIDEIKELRQLLHSGKAPRGVEPETIEAIDSVRDIGNIGAHMEKDINMIVDVDPGEAQALIELIEMLFDEWYVARHKREQRLAAVQAIAAEKKATIASLRAQAEQNKLASAEDESPTTEA